MRISGHKSILTVDLARSRRKNGTSESPETGDHLAAVLHGLTHLWMCLAGLAEPHEPR